MNMSFGVAAAPPAPADLGGTDQQPASSTSSAASTPLPPVPAPFSLPSTSFTFQGPPANLMPPSRLPAAPPSAAFPFTSALPRFAYPNPPSSVPSSASPAPPFSMQPGFSFQGPSGNHIPSAGAPGQAMLGMTSLQVGGVGQSPGVAVRHFAPPALQTTLSGAAQAGPPPPPLQVSGTPGAQAGSTPPAEGAATQGSPSVAMPTGTGASTEAVVAAPTGNLAVPGMQARPVVGQIPISAVSPPVGGVPGARPGLVAPPSAAVPFGVPRPPFANNAVAPPAIVPPGVLGSAPAGMAPRFPSPPFAPMVRPTFPPRPGTPLVRPPGALIRPGALLPKFPLGPDLTKAAGAYLLLEKPQTLVYVGKIASTVDDEFLRSILELCGPIKSWKRAQEPTTGTPKGFGFCEFELPDGVLRALRLLHGFSLEGQELLITVNHTTREYLERFVQKKKEKEVQAKLEASQVAEMEVETAPGVEAPEPVKKPPVEEAPKVDESIESKESDPKIFGLVNDEDKEKDVEAQKKLASLLEERAKSMPLPPPPPLPGVSDAPCKSNSMSDTPVKSRDGDSVADGGRSGGQEVNNDDETSKDKGSSELEKLDTGSSEQGRRFDHHRDRNRDRERERDREIDRGRDNRAGRDRERERERERQEKEDREDEQSEREREKKRARRERDREMRNRHAERQFENREKDWERDEKEKERRRNVDREKEKEREKLRKRLIKEQEEGSDDEARKKMKRRGYHDEHKRRQREREDDEYDRQKEEEEIVEAKHRKLKEEYEEQVRKKLAEIAEAEAAAKAAARALNSSEEGSDEPDTGRPFADGDEQRDAQMADVGIDACNDMGIDGRASASMEIDEKRSSSPPLKKLGFGLIGSGKRAVVPSLFHHEDEEEEPKERGIRELVPIEYTVEEMQAVSSLKMNAAMGNAGLNLAAAAEFAKSLGHVSLKEEFDSEHDKGRRQSDKSKGRDRDRASREETDRSRDRDKDKHRQVDGGREKDHTVAKFDTKQLIDTIPKTKDELFAYKIDWKIYDQHDLHERMKPWIQKKILEFLGEEEDTLVEYIVSNTRKHTGASEMLELLTTILDDEAEMFVMKLWRMLIFEVKKIETGLSSKPRG